MIHDRIFRKGTGFAVAMFLAPAGAAFASEATPVAASGGLPGVWAPVAVIASSATVIVQAVFVSATQCRPLTFDEAVTATVPVVGFGINALRPVDNRCAKP